MNNVLFMTIVNWKCPQLRMHLINLPRIRVYPSIRKWPQNTPLISLQLGEITQHMAHFVTKCQYLRQFIAPRMKKKIKKVDECDFAPFQSQNTIHQGLFVLNLCLFFQASCWHVKQVFSNFLFPLAMIMISLRTYGNPTWDTRLIGHRFLNFILCLPQNNKSRDRGSHRRVIVQGDIMAK